MTQSASASHAAEPEAAFVASVRAGDTVAGKYLVGRTLGIGGMGVVFAARDQALDRPVAIKVLLPRLSSSETAAQRFVREARAATRITSEHVVKLLEIETLPDKTPLLVMEYLAGRDLRAVLRDEGPLAPRIAIDYLLQAAQAVAEGHVQGIVHRDLKPSNLFLTARADGTPLIKVLDFGIAKTLESELSGHFELTSSDDVRLGSPTYMPPEQLTNPRAVDARADIWALGVTLYELVSGRTPFHGQTYAELVSRILNAPPASLQLQLSEFALPPGLAEIIFKCLQKDAGDRFASVAELAAALAPFGSDDARLSLHRVSGLGRAPISPRPASSSSLAIARDSLGACETTLPAPPEASSEHEHSSTARSARPSAAHSSRQIGVLAFSAISVLGAFVSVFAHERTLPATPAPSLTAREHREPPLAPVATTPAMSADPQVPPVEAQASESRSLPSTKTEITPTPIRRKPPPPNARGSEFTHLTPPSTSSSATSPPAVSPEAAPSPSIEDLIQKRH
ncbi:MAG TPA: protein kinase [Polyangiaceae bacterium]|jgi:serine/threonine-protein kinase|nr:protein kinase [Polyangiaceae bacterium]